ncbi:hypothetical protein [Ammoniphilus sp. 3BR4]
MPDRKQPNDKPQRKNAIGQVQDQLHQQADAIQALQSRARGDK